MGQFGDEQRLADLVGGIGLDLPAGAGTGPEADLVEVAVPWRVIDFLVVGRGALGLPDDHACRAFDAVVAVAVLPLIEDAFSVDVEAGGESLAHDGDMVERSGREGGGDACVGTAVLSQLHLVAADDLEEEGGGIGLDAETIAV